MAHQVKVSPADNFPTTPPATIGAEFALPDGSLVRATRGHAAGSLVWALLFAGSVLATVAGLVDKLPGALPTVSSDGHTLTAAASGAFNDTTPGGRTWLVGDRVLVVDGSAPKLAGVWVVISLGSGSTPWVLSRAMDARTSAAFFLGRTFGVTDGGSAGQLYTHASAFAGSIPEPGVDQLFFARASFNGVKPADLYSSGISSFQAGPEFVMAVPVVAAGSSAARDVVVFNPGAGGSPMDLELVSVAMNVQAAGADATSMQARSLAAGAGSALSGPVPTDATGKALEGPGGALAADLTIVSGGGLYLRFGDGHAGGRVFLTFRPV